MDYFEEKNSFSLLEIWMLNLKQSLFGFDQYFERQEKDEISSIFLSERLKETSEEEILLQKQYEA